MLRLKKIAVTGSIASGKSSVSKIFEELGAFVISADEIVHHLLVSDPPLIKQLQALLGAEIVKEGRIDRQSIATKIFKDADLRKQTEALLHPLVRQEMERAEEAVKAKGNVRLFVAEIPLLFEKELDKQFDITIAVTSPRALRLERFKKRTGLSEKEFAERESAQFSEEDKKKRAHIVIQNSGSLEELAREVRRLLNQLNP